MFRLDGKVVLVTGSSRGLGWAIARAMAGQGAHVVVNGRSASTVLARVDELVDAGRSASRAVFDVDDREVAGAALADVAARHGRLDVLVNNAGINRRHPVGEFVDADWDAVIATNLDAVFALSRAASRHMVAARSGRIIMTGSMMGTVARPTIAAYVASKGGVTALTKALAVELGPHGVTVNVIGPGYVATEMNTALVDDPEFDAMVRARTPVSRWGRPDEVAAAAVFLAADEASYINGHLLMVDGGMSIAL